MKLKSLLKFSLPIIGIAAVSVTLPIALTACSNSSSKDITLKTDLAKHTIVTNLGKDFELKLEPNGNVNDYGYQWYVKTPTRMKTVLTNDLTDNEILVPPQLNGFEAISNQNKNVLVIPKAQFDKFENNQYEFACAIYSKSNTTNYIVSDTTTLEIAKQNNIQQDNITKVQNLAQSWINASLEGNVDSNGVITSDTLKNQIAFDLGLATDENGQNSVVKEIKITKSEANSKEQFGISLDLVVTLKEDQTWNESMYGSNSGLTGVKINDKNQLVIENIKTNVGVQLGTVSLSDEQLTSINNVITQAFTKLTSKEDVTTIEEELPNSINTASGISGTNLAFVSSATINLEQNTNAVYSTIATVTLSFDGNPTFEFSGSHTNWTTSGSELTLSNVPTSIVVGAKEKEATLTKFATKLNEYIAGFPTPSININKIQGMISTPVVYSTSENESQFQQLLSGLNLASEDVQQITLQLEANNGTSSPWGYQFPIKMVITYNSDVFSSQVTKSGTLKANPNMKYTATGNGKIVTIQFINNYEFIKIPIDDTNDDKNNQSVTISGSDKGINKQSVDNINSYLQTLTGSISSADLNKDITIMSTDSTYNEFFNNIATKLNVPVQVINSVTLNFKNSSSKVNVEMSVTFKNYIVFTVSRGYIMGSSNYKATFNLNNKYQEVISFPSTQTQITNSN